MHSKQDYTKQVFTQESEVFVDEATARNQPASEGADICDSPSSSSDGTSTSSVIGSTFGTAIGAGIADDGVVAAGNNDVAVAAAVAAGDGDGGASLIGLAGAHLLNSATQFCRVLIGTMQSTVCAGVCRRNTSMNAIICGGASSKRKKRILL